MSECLSCLRGPGCCKLFPRKAFNAEVLDINELRVYHARLWTLPDYRVSQPIDQPLVLEPGGRVLVPTGFRIALQSGFEAQVRARSGLALKHGIICPNAPGTVDSDYRGEVGVILANTHSFDYAILYVGSMGVLGLFSYLFIVGPLDRLTLTPRTV